MNTKPQMWMDSTLPRTHQVPVHPETGKVWSERAQQLCFLATCLRYEADQDPQWEIDYAALTAGVEFREEPLVMECHFMFGSAVKVKGPPPKVFKCHPDTWAGMTEEHRRYFDLKTAEERVFVMPEGTTPPPFARLKQKETGK
jgi:hypothetical protein